VIEAEQSPAAFAASEHAGYVLALADDPLVLAQRCGEWIAAAPEIEEDIALANLGLDLLGQARLLLSHAAELEEQGRDEDDLAFFRDPAEFRNVLLCELPNGNFAVTMARMLLFSSYQLALYDRLRSSTDTALAGIAARAAKEVSYHRDHATQWVLRLGDGTRASSIRMQAAVEAVWPFLAELFEDGWLPDALVEAGIAVRPSDLEPGVRRYLSDVLTEATLAAPTLPAQRSQGSNTRASDAGGRHGLHTEHLAALLAELQSVARAHPGVRW